MIPYDKSVHGNAGAIIASVVSLVGFLIAMWIDKVGHLFLVPPVALLVVFVAARYKELRDLRGYGSYDVNDQIATVYGGLAVTAPQFVLILGLMIKAGAL